MEFQFVDESTRANDALVRRQVRRHAAKGHNAGRTVSRAKGRLVIHERPGDLLPSLESRQKALVARKNFERVGSHNFLKRVGDDIGCLDVPAAWTPCRRRVQQVIKFLLHPVHAERLSRVIAPNQAGGVATAAMGLWVRLMFTDEACMHSTMATAIIALNNANILKENISHAYHHFGVVLHNLNKKMATSEAVSDATMAAVIIATQYERYRNAYASGIAHMEGVQRMIAMRGGFAAVAAGNPVLGHKVLRADLEYSLHLGYPTRFTVDEMRSLVGPSLLVETSQPHNQSAVTQSNLGSWLSLSLNPPLKTLLDEMREFTQAINGADRGIRPKFDAIKLDNEMIAFGYRLSDICPLGRSISSSLVERLIHVGLGATMATTLLGLDARPLVLPHLLPKTMSIANDIQLDQWEEDLQKIWFWVLCMGESACIFQTVEEQSWVIRQIVSLKEALGLQNWKQAEGVLLEFPWARCLHEYAALELWNRAGRFRAREQGRILASVSE